MARPYNPDKPPIRKGFPEYVNDAFIKGMQLPEHTGEVWGVRKLTKQWLREVTPTYVEQARRVDDLHASADRAKAFFTFPDAQGKWAVMLFYRLCNLGAVLQLVANQERDVPGYGPRLYMTEYSISHELGVAASRRQVLKRAPGEVAWDGSQLEEGYMIVTRPDTVDLLYREDNKFITPPLRPNINMPGAFKGATEWLRKCTDVTWQQDLQVVLPQEVS